MSPEDLIHLPCVPAGPNEAGVVSPCLPGGGWQGEHWSCRALLGSSSLPRHWCFWGTCWLSRDVSLRKPWTNSIPIASGDGALVFPPQQMKSGAFISSFSGNWCFLGIAYKELSNSLDCHPEVLGLLHDLAWFSLFFFFQRNTSSRCSQGFACGRQNRASLNKISLNKKINWMPFILPVTSLFTPWPLSAIKVLSDFSILKHLHSFSENNNNCQRMNSLFSQNAYCSVSNPHCFSSLASGLQWNQLYLQWKAKYIRARQLTISLQSITA